jgi:hypothetical protein
MARMIYQHATTKADQAIAKALGETISAARDDKVCEHDEERSAARPMAGEWPADQIGVRTNEGPGRENLPATWPSSSERVTVQLLLRQPVGRHGSPLGPR